MRRILLLFAVLTTLNSTAQDPQLEENIWYLENLILSGGDNIPPSNPEAPYVYLQFVGSDWFDTGSCNSLAGMVTYHSALPEFTLGKLNETLVVCEIPENEYFQNLYFNDFYRANQPSPFSYVIVENTDSSKTLTITGDNGDYGIYSSALLHVNQHQISIITVHPNPIENDVIIEKVDNIEAIQLRVYDLFGKLKLTKKIKATNNVSVNTTSLISGVYFFVFETGDGRIEIKKIIKK